MGRKVITIWLCLTMMLGMIVIVDVTVDFTLKITGTTLYVNTTGSGGAYTSIQDAINASKDGDTVFVYNGTYYENIDLNKRIYLIGKDKLNTIIDGSGSGNIIYVTVDWVTIMNFTIIDGEYGIRLSSSSYNTIEYNRIENMKNGGIFLTESSNENIILNNNISDCKDQNSNGGGINILFSSGNKILDNNVSDNMNAIHLYSSPYCNITNNILNNNSGGLSIGDSDYNLIKLNKILHTSNNAISLRGSSNNTVIFNNVYNNRWGIQISDDSNNNNISFNNVFSNIKTGLNVLSISNNTISYNNVSNNEEGIVISYSSNCKVMKNNITFNYKGGIAIGKSFNISIENNVFIDDGVTINGDQLSHYTSQNIPDNNSINGRPLLYFKDKNGISIDGEQIGELILANCTDITVKNLNITKTAVGILIAFCMNISIINNNLSENNYGIIIYAIENTTLMANSIFSNINYGIYIASSNYINMSYNVISSKGMGIYQHSSSYNHINGNNITYNNDTGIYVRWSHNNNIQDNNISNNNKSGIDMEFSDYNMIYRNIFYSNNIYGVIHRSSYNNIIFHNNFIDNNGQSIDYTDNGSQWDNGYPLGGNYWSDYVGNDSFKGYAQNVIGSDGIGDTPYTNIDWTTGSQDDYPLMQPYKTIENYTILKQGWNLISIPILQEEQNLTRVLGSIESWYSAVQWYDSTDSNDFWRHHKVSKPFGNDLFELNETMGFWIHITRPRDTIFLYNGTQPTSNQTITLHPGWNMVGYPSLTSYNRTEGLNNLTFNDQVDAIWTYDAATQKWEEMGESDYFQLGRGYYIHAKSEYEWEVPL